MRIAVDAIPLLVRSAGVKNYLYHWIVHLRRLLGEDYVALFPFLDRLDHLDHEGSIADRPGTLARQGLLFALNLWPDNSSLPGTLVDLMSTADIFHATKLLHPPHRPRLTATLHDMTCWLLPQFHQAANVAAEKRFAATIWKRADGLMAVSESTRRDAIQVLGLDPARIRVIYPGVASAYFTADTATAAAARLKHALNRPYALYVGTVEPRKNLAGMLDAWAALSASVRQEFDLVLAGPEGWQSAETMQRLRSDTGGVRYMGYVPETDLPGITAGASAFVYPSFYEGFGFPVAQAMAAGVPVVTSNISSLPEVTGGAAALIDPYSVSEIRDALETLLTSPAMRARLSDAGRSRARIFTWDACARDSLLFCRDILGRM